MFQKIRKTILVMAAAVIVLSPAAKAAEYSTQSAQNEENCISWILQALQPEKAEQPAAAKSGFEVQDGRLYHYTDGQLDVYQPGFVQIEDGVYHVSAAGSVIDPYPAGMVKVDGVLCHVSVTGSHFDNYPAGFVTIDGKLYHVSKDGYAIDSYSAGEHEIDGGLSRRTALS